MIENDHFGERIDVLRRCLLQSFASHFFMSIIEWGYFGTYNIFPEAYRRVMPFEHYVQFAVHFWGSLLMGQDI